MEKKDENILRILQCALSSWAFGTSMAVPFGVGIVAIYEKAWVALLFGIISTVTGSLMLTLKSLGRWKSISVYLISAISLIVGLLLGIYKSIYLLPVAVLFANFFYWFIIQKWWDPIMNSVSAFVFPWRFIQVGVLFLTFCTVLQILRLSVFMIDSSFKPGWPIPYAKESSNHQCLIAYVHAAALNQKGIRDLYNSAWYDPNLSSENIQGDSLHRAEPILVGSEELLRDVWQYPPQALILPQLAVSLTNSYPLIKAGWFALQSVLLSFLLFAISNCLKRSAASLMLMPIMWCALPFVTNMNYGQPHFLIICAAAYASILFEKKHDIGGGFFLAWAISMKIFPGLLVLFLLFKKRFRAVAWVFFWSIIIVIVSLPIVGLNPYNAFLEYQIFRILNGAAWDNYLSGELFGTGQFTIYGLLLSLSSIGGKTFFGQAASFAYVLYSVFVIALTWFSATKTVSPFAGIALVNLAAMAGYYSPPSYATVGVTALALLTIKYYKHRSIMIIIPLGLWMFFSIASSPGSLPVIWRYKWIMEVVYIVSFFAALWVNTTVALKTYVEEDVVE